MKFSKSLKVAVVSLFLLLNSVALNAQVSVPPTTQQFAFDHDGTADGYAYFLDGNRVDLGQLTSVGTTQTGLNIYRFAVPAMTPGTHTLNVVAYKSGFGDSLPSETITLQVIVLTAPTGLRLIPVGQ